VEDDELVNEGNRRVLAEAGVDTIAATKLAKAIEILREREVDAIVLDIIMPDGDGTEWVERMRELSDAPILFLSGKTEKVSVLEGYSVGGIDYITKPYDIDIFAAKVLSLINAHLPKTHAVPSWEMSLGNLKLDSVAARAFATGKDMMLTSHEFAILTCLASQSGHLMSDKEIYELVWNCSYRAGDDHLVRKHISNIRHKLDRGDSDYNIFNVYGKGYRLAKI
jgi:DNA-binding response OmpR family regulator